MIVEEDDETQTSGAMDGRHENNPSDGLFNNPSDGMMDCLSDQYCNQNGRSHPGILSMKPTTDASRPSGARVQKSTPSTTEGPPAGPSDQVKRR